MILRFDGKVAVVTGGASGIGAGIVRAFVREGAAVLFIDPDETAAQALVNELGRSQCGYFAGDISRQQDCSAAIELAESSFGPVSHLVNNAAMFLYRSLEATADEWAAILRVNVVGASLMSRFASESMMRSEGESTITNIGSISAFIAQPGTMTYNATKAALVEMTRCMALDLSRSRIRVNCVCPGYTLTKAFYDYAQTSGRPAPAVEAELAAQTILGRLATPEDIAESVLFLASPQAGYITGSILMVDGGMTCR